jgi:hypothetical protein
MPKNYDASLARQEDLIPARAACAVSSIQRMGYSFADSPSGGKPVRSRETGQSTRFGKRTLRRLCKRQEAEDVETGV